MNVLQPLFHFARTQAEFPALIDAERTLTYGQLASEVARTAGHLRTLGLRPGGRIGVCLKDGSQFIVALLAAGLLGAAGVPMNYRAQRVDNAAVARLLGLDVVLCEPDDLLASLMPVTPIDAAWQRAVATAVPWHEPHADWNAAFLFAPTAGTTGANKFTAVSQLNFFFRAMMSAGADAGTRASAAPTRVLSVLPLSFGAGHSRCMSHLLWGDTVILFPPLFSAQEYVEAVARLNIGLSQVVPTIIRQLLRLPNSGRFLLPGLGSLLSTGAPLFADEKREAAARLTPNFFEVYGTSSIGGICRLLPRDLDARAESVGQPYATVEIQTVDENGHPVGPDAVGRLRVRGPAVGQPVTPVSGDAVPSEEFRDEWCYPGELAVIDSQGFLFIKGRTSDVIIRNGAKINPSEIEAALQQHPAVTDSAVLGTMGKDNEEIITAFVVTREPIDPATLLAHCRARLTAYKVPGDIRVVDSLPRNTAGKVVKSELAKRLREG